MTETTVIQADPYVQQWNIWHTQRVEELTAPHGYLAPASINWVANGETKTIDGVPGTWSAENDTLIYTPGQDGRVTNAGEPLDEPIAFTPTAFGEQALGYVEYGDLRLEINSQTDAIKRNTHRFWIRVKDPNTDRRRDFTAIPHYPVDPKWRFAATFRRATEDEQDIHDSVVTTVLQSYPVVGFVEFDHNGEHYSLVVSNVFGHASIFFSDETTGKETYGIGRVLQLDALGIDSLDSIDFNYAYNYPCAFSPYCTCPIPSKRNHLPFAVTAGERTPLEAQY
ncbi:DUF1684 domain-containing protein [Bifidobacterium eulemuris]|uniref:DUF1684 domain-containing protein n=1 Tax=Bifidobacterium eulemuris TaxID=1765219 RepID=A0A261G7B8_9BIFI|nr:DUF1684 domain-containing protein [Bifidobacterium eulemuris]OZG67308.1 hypothetical protein BEUL_1399 [Bifidobacterium eulemuris]QOL32891.1 DUF1684 domain-containing protein [Bifidobacterium eulemuris]